MENENIYTALIYLQYELLNETASSAEPLEYYKVVDKINFRIRSKTEITKVLESPEAKEDFLIACSSLSAKFLSKIKEIVSDENDDSIATLNKNIELILNISTTGRRTQQSFYALWYFLSKVKAKSIKAQKQQIRIDLNELFKSMNMVASKEKFESKIKLFWGKYK